MFENSSIYFDEFYGFTPQEYMIFEELLKKCDEISFAFCLDKIESDKAKENDIFYFNRLFAKKILSIGDEQKAKLNLVNLEENFRSKNDELKALEKILLGESVNFENKTQNIELFLANNPYSELEHIAKKIYNLVKNENYKYRDIAVSVSDIDCYSEDAKAIFKKYDIPIFIDDKKDLNQNLLIKYMLSLLDIYANNWSFDSVFNYLKIGLLDFDYYDICLLENYCTKWGIRGSKWYRREFNYEPINETQEKLEKIRKEFVNSLINLKENFNQNKTVEELSKYLYQFLINNKIIENLDKKIKETNSVEINNEYNTSYKIVIDLLEEMVILFGNEKVTFEKFRDLFLIGIKFSELGKIPATQDQVVLGDLDRTRSDKIKILFVLGINDGNFPKVNNRRRLFK